MRDQSAYSKAWYAANKNRHLANGRAWAKANPGKRRAIEERWRKANPEKIAAKKRRQYAAAPEKECTRVAGWRTANPDTYRAINLKRNYGITAEQFNAMLAGQGGQCAICSTNTPGGKGTFHVDHCHNTNQIRGLLCHNCNLGIGHLKDSPTILQKAIEYLNDGDNTVNTDVSKLVAGYRQLRDKKGQLESALKARVAPITEMMDKIEARLLQLADAQKVDSFKTAAGTVYKYKASSVRVKDWPSFLEYVRDNDEWELLTRGASKNEVIAHAADAAPPPGIEIFNEFKMGFRAPTK